MTTFIATRFDSQAHDKNKSSRTKAFDKARQPSLWRDLPVGDTYRRKWQTYRIIKPGGPEQPIIDLALKTIASRANHANEGEWKYDFDTEGEWLFIKQHTGWEGDKDDYFFHHYCIHLSEFTAAELAALRRRPPRGK